MARGKGEARWRPSLHAARQEKGKEALGPHCCRGRGECVRACVFPVRLRGRLRRSTRRHFGGPSTDTPELEGLWGTKWRIFWTCETPRREGPRPGHPATHSPGDDPVRVRPGGPFSRGICPFWEGPIRPGFSRPTRRRPNSRKGGRGRGKRGDPNFRGRFRASGALPEGADGTGGSAGPPGPSHLRGLELSPGGTPMSNPEPRASVLFPWSEIDCC